MERKKSYAPPRLAIYGNVKALTQGTQTGDCLDADFKAGTPRGQLTFSDAACKA